MKGTTKGFKFGFLIYLKKTPGGSFLLTIRFIRAKLKAALEFKNLRKGESYAEA
jgi:hypothetical protein